MNLQWVGIGWVECKDGNQQRPKTQHKLALTDPDQEREYLVKGSGEEKEREETSWRRKNCCGRMGWVEGNVTKALKEHKNGAKIAQIPVRTENIVHVVNLRSKSAQETFKCIRDKS